MRQLVPALPDDRYLRLFYRYLPLVEGVPAKAVIVPEEEASETCGWIDIWASDAKACKDALKRIVGRLAVLQERREKRTKELTDDKAVEEMEEYNSLLIAGLAHRTKAWQLITSDGERVDEALTFEEAKAFYGSENHNIRSVVQDHINGRENFPLRASTSS